MEDKALSLQTSQPIKLLIIAIMGGLIAVSIILGLQYQVPHIFGFKKNTIVTVDLKKIIHPKRNEIIDKYKGAYTEENVKKAEQELQIFTDKLQEGIKSVSSGQTVLLKDVVIGDSIDITDKLIEYMKKNEKQ
ncbi:MAG: hypothetical protein ABFD50_09010 [Smithella sp.]